MQIYIRELFEAGEKYGEYYEAMNLDFSEHGELQCSLGIRVVRRPSGMFEFHRVSSDSSGEQHGKWSFSTEEFKELSQMVRKWREQRYELGMYGSVLVMSHRTRKYYQPAGKYSEAVFLPARKTGVLASEKVNNKFGDKWMERARILSGNGEPVGRVFNWQGVSLYWAREFMTLARLGSAEKAMEEMSIWESLTTRSPMHFSLRAYLKISLAEAKYVNGIGELSEKVRGGYDKNK